MEKIEIVATCTQHGENKGGYGRPWAYFLQDGALEGLGTLTMAGEPIAGKIEKGKKYRITIEEVKE